MSKQQQTSQQKQMTINVEYCKNLSKEVPMSALELKLEQTKVLYAEFKENQNKLEEACAETKDLEVQMTLRAQFNDQYYYCYVILKERVKAIEDAKALASALANATKVNQNDGANKQKEVKLPRIELTPFTGNYEDWATFHDIFNSLIHTNKTIDDVQKLHYLKKNVQGTAETLLKSISITEANYAEAWKKLNDRFNHKRFIVDSLLTAFFNQPKIIYENHENLKKLIDKSSEIIHSLQLQGIPVDEWDVILVHVVVSKLDAETHKQWELKQTKDHLPLFSELEEFIEGRWQSLEMIQKSNENAESSRGQSQEFKNNRSTESQKRRTESICFCCKSSNHKLYSCQRYGQLNVTERRNVLKENRLCFNCLSNGHTISGCTSLSRCKTCKSKHHSSIHIESHNSKNEVQENSSTSQNNDRKHSGVTSTRSKNKRVLLATAIVYVHGSNGVQFPAKALVDPGSTNAVITNSLAKKLRLKMEPDNSKIVGIGDVEVQERISCVNLRVSSFVDITFSMDLEANTMDTITGNLPFMPIKREEWPQLTGLKLADPHFEKPSPIEILLGAEAYEQILLEGIIRKRNGSPTAINSHLGWLLFGSVERAVEISSHQQSKQCLLMMKSDALDKQLKLFWEMEEVPEQRKLTMKEQLAENSFLENVHRNEEGRYVVALPFDPDQNLKEIGESKKAAMANLFHMENRFKKDAKLKERYSNYIQALIDADHIELVPDDRMELDDSEKFYLPHHSVIKEESLTTKLRVVFDASRKSSTGISLNDKLLVGAKIQEDLFCILIRWRKHRYVFLADAEKMYRQVKLIQEHRDFQRMLWRFDRNSRILEFRITTIIDGTASASFLATRVLQQMAEDQSEKFPEAANIVKSDFYMDDMSSGSHSIEKAKQLQNDVIQIMDHGKFKMRKWLSNSKEILENVPVENRHDPDTLVEIIENSVKTLGVFWNPIKDAFEFKIAACSKSNSLTKRELLSEISRLFDPIGWLAPSTVMAKILMQSLWSIKHLEWDHKVPQDRMKIWIRYRDELHFLEKIKIPRWIGTDEVVKLQLHGFGDASDSAYSAVIYSRVEKSDGSVKVNIMSAKTKVAPMKTVSTPKLELCAAVLVSRLLDKILESLKMKDVETFAYSDNTTVLAWIVSQPNRFNVFVANRITEIQNLTKNSKWSFVSTDENPADCASRGIFPSELVEHKLWWHGPRWLSQSRSQWPSYDENYETDLEKKRMQSHTFHLASLPQDEYLTTVMKKHSTLSRLLWNSAYVVRFCSSTKFGPRKEFEPPNAQDLRNALVKWTRYIQLITFKEDIERIKSGEELLSRSKLKKLRPFIDKNGLLRVGGRLSKSELIFNAKHPIILPKNNYFTDLVIQQAHKYTLHGGPTLVSSYLQNYWIFSRSKQVKRIISRCMICFPHRFKPAGQIMADLPSCRVTKHRPFLHSGVDFAGPITTKTYTGRSRGIHSNPTQKSYISIFVCMSTKALHIELVSDYTSDAFIACYRRFVSRRGRCTDLYSDLGSNFVGANNEMTAQFLSLMKDSNLQSYLSHDGTSWHFNPPLSPHFGGLWEAGVKSTKYHLNRLTGNNKFTFEELTTLLYQIEACLNSRPLCAISDDINDMSYLTPGHFLIGEAPISVPEVNLLDTNINRLSRWKLIQHTYQQFWKVWHKEYLSNLQQRPKWLKEKENIRVGQLVLLQEEENPPAKWPVARIVKVHPGDDGKVRVVTLEKYSVSIKPPIPKDLEQYLKKLKTHKSVFERNVTKISPLPFEEDGI